MFSEFLYLDILDHLLLGNGGRLFDFSVKWDDFASKLHDCFIKQLLVDWILIIDLVLARATTLHQSGCNHGH